MKKYLLLAIPALITAMSTSSQELKTYSGPFTCMDIYGEATYTYRDAEDGTRIFHGDLIFRGYDRGTVIQGKFTDNKQTGTWSYNIWDDDSSVDVVINFNKEGYPDGEVSYIYYENKCTFSIKDGKIEGLVKISDCDDDGEYITTYSMTGGIVNGEYTVTYDGEAYRTGMFDNGKPIGKWVSDNGRKSAYYDDNGELKYVIDETTGDKLTDKHFDIYIPEYAIDETTGDNLIDKHFDIYVPEIPELCKNLDRFLMRDSKLKPETSNNSDNSAIDMSGKIYDAIEQDAQFPGGSNVLNKWLCNNLRYPKIPKKNGVQGCVIVQFVVETDGSISNPTVVRGVDKDLDEEALRIVRKMPRWQPHKSNGVAVRSRYVLPISFKLS